MARLIIVTGGNRGIGFEVCRKLVSDGDKIILTSRSQEKGAAAAKQIEAATEAHSAIAVLPLDVSSSTSIDQFVEVIKEDYDGQVDILINNGGILSNDWTEAAVDSMIHTNVIGQFELTQKLAPTLREGARIIMVSSGLADVIPEDSIYRELTTRNFTTIEEFKHVDFHPEDPIKSMFSPAYSLSKLLLNLGSKLLSQSKRFLDMKFTVDVVYPGWCRTDMGSDEAPSSAEEGAEVIVKAANVDPPTTGLVYKDGLPSTL